MAVDVVVEIAPARLPRASLAGQPIGPIEERLVGVAAPIFAGRAVEADISGSAARPARRRETFEIMRDKADTVSVEKRQYFLVVPALVSKLDDLLQVLRQPREEGIEALDILMQARRQLVEQWPKLLFQRPSQRDEAVDLGLAVEQLLHMRDEAVDLDCVAEARRCLFPPSLEC